VTRIKYFSAPWCMNCKFMWPWMQELYPEAERIEIADTDDPVVEEFGLVSLPSIIAFDAEGKELGRLTGGNNKQAIQDFLAPVL